MIRVGFVGLGVMGAPMAAHLIDWPGGLVVYDLRPEAAAPFAERDATVAGSVTELASMADVVSLMVLDDAQVRDVVGAMLPHLAAGSVIAVHSTIHAATAVELAQATSVVGVELVDAPVSGGVLGAHAGRLAVMVGGDRAAFEKCKEPFSRFADLVVHSGPVGAGTRVKVARNVINFAGFAAALEAAALAEAAGVDLKQLASVTTHSDKVIGGPGSILVRDRCGPLAPDDPLRPIFEHTRDLGEKDLALAIELAEEVGVDIPLARVTLERLAAGLGVAHEHTTREHES
jgi:3-hydroxyisobutyrate dehydrogenase